jgi:hypothetical protein
MWQCGKAFEDMPAFEMQNGFWPFLAAKAEETLQTATLPQNHKVWQKMKALQTDRQTDKMNDHRNKDCPICHKQMRSDTLYRHLWSHRKQIISIMDKPTLDAIIGIETPILTSGDVAKKKAYGACLHCYKGFTDKSSAERKDWIRRHLNQECKDFWHKYAGFFTGKADPPPSAPATPLQNVVTVTESRHATEYGLSESTVEALRAWGKDMAMSDSHTLDDLVLNLLESECNYRQQSGDCS